LGSGCTRFRWRENTSPYFWFSLVLDLVHDSVANPPTLLAYQNNTNTCVQPMSYLPLSVCHWQEAIKSVFSGKVTVVDVYEGVSVRAANLEIPLPSVIALNEFVPHNSHRPAFTRRNVFLRDEYTCQYCSDQFHARDLSIDHVVPRSMGGHLNWYVLS